MSEIPNVVILKPITPTIESRASTRLEYADLQRSSEKASKYETLRQYKFWGTELDSLAESQAGRQLASQYLLMTAYRQNAALTPESARLWGERYTEATVELYGEPEAETAQALIFNQYTDLTERARKSAVDTELVERYRELARSYGIDDVRNVEMGAETIEFTHEAELIGGVLLQRFNDAYTALDLEDAPRRIDSQGIVDRFTAALHVLGDVHDVNWLEWEVHLDPTKDSLAVNAGEKKIIVGAERASVSPLELKGLFTHEVLLHALRAVNGAQISKELGSGLPGYVDAEEGLGSFFEYAVTGIVPEKNIDRYVDIALALGQIDGVQKTRQQMIDFAIIRSLIRNECVGSEDRSTVAAIQAKATTHINRIYRGTTGDDAIGIFTKDIVYQKGFMEQGGYIKSSLAMGVSAEQLIDRLLFGKYDPLNQLHLDYIRTVLPTV